MLTPAPRPTVTAYPIATPAHLLTTKELVDTLRYVIANAPRTPRLLSIGKRDGELRLGSVADLLTAIRADPARAALPNTTSGAIHRLLNGNAAQSIATQAGDERLLLWLACVWAYDAKVSAPLLHEHLMRAVPSACISVWQLYPTLKAIKGAVGARLPDPAGRLADPSDLLTRIEREKRGLKRNKEEYERKNPGKPNPWANR